MPGAAEDSPAIRKLGRLFRRTESHVWDESYVAGANGSHKYWRSVETGLDGFKTDQIHTKQNNQLIEGNLFVEDLEFCNLMGSMGLPVSFGTSKEKKNTANKVKKKGKVSYEAACTLMDDAVRTCLSTNEVESVVQLMACVDETNPCSPSRTAVGYNEGCPDDIGKILGENCVSVKQPEEYNCGTLCSAEIVIGNEAENSCVHASMGNPIKSDCPVRENEDVGSVLQLNKEMLEQDSVDNDPRIFCTEIRHSEMLATTKDRTYGEAPSTSHDNNDVDRGACLSSEDPSPVDSHAPEYDSNFYCEYGDWRVIWDPLYNRYYFYNILTQESTWSPPHGLEDFGLYFSTCIQSFDELGSQYTNIQVQEHDQAGDDKHLDGKGQHCYNELSNLADIPDEEAMTQSTINTIDEAYPAENIQNDSSMNEALEMNQEVVSTEKKKRVRRSQSYHSCQDLSGDISIDIGKYWTQRYSLFSLFDSGIKMDEEGWFSVTPEPIAKHHASRVGAGVVIDCFTGVGGNAIQFATKCKHVIAVDIDPQKIDCAQHNATVYGVNDHIDFLIADFIHIAPHLKADTAFMSPPWGGPDYAKVDVYDIKTMLKPCDGYSLFKLARAIASRVVMFLPRNIDQNQLADMCLSVDPPWAVEVEKNFLNGKLKAITAYFEEQDSSDMQHMSDANPQNADEQDEMGQEDDRGLGAVG